MSIYFWHVWSDNAYLFVYIFSLGLLLAGLVLALQSLHRFSSWSWLKVLGVLVLALIISVGIIKGSGLSSKLSEQILAGGNGSQSPCLAEIRSRLSTVPEASDAGQFRTTVSSEEDEVVAQLGLEPTLIPGFIGLTLIFVTLWLKRGRETLRAKIAGDVAAISLVSYIYLRGPSAWCGQLFGLDIFVVTVVIGFMLIKFLPKLSVK